MDMSARIGAYKPEDTSQNITLVMVSKATSVETQMVTKTFGALQKMPRKNGAGASHCQSHQENTVTN